MSVAWTYTPPTVNAAALIAAAGTEAVRAAAEQIAERSRGLVPVDTGALRDSLRVDSDGLEAAISYTATAEDGYPYGIRQHEDLTLHHPNGGQAKFLEQPMHAGADHTAALIAAALRQVLG